MNQGISPVVTTVLLVAITVIAGVTVWFWVSPYASMPPVSSTAQKAFIVTSVYNNATKDGCNELDLKNNGGTVLSNIVLEVRDLGTGRPAGVNGTNPAQPIYVNVSELVPGMTKKFNLSVAGDSSSRYSVPIGTYLLRAVSVPGMSDQTFVCSPLAAGSTNVEASIPGWWSGSFLYRQQVNLSVSANATRQGHQVQIALSSANVGASFNWTNNCKDLRFINGSDDTELSYWVENCSTTNQNASVWVKVDQNITASNYTIYMYYGNNDASNASDGTNTFEIFDDFLGSSLNASKWNSWTNASCAITVTSGYLRLNGPAGNEHKCRVYSLASTSYSVLTYVYRMPQPYMSVFAIINSTNENVWPEQNATGGRSFRTYRSSTYSTFIVQNTSHTIFTENVANPSASTWYTEHVYYGPQYQSAVRGATILSSTNKKMEGDLPYRIWIGYGSPYDVAGDVNIDLVYLRKYALPEPTVSMGAEENQP